MLTCELGNAANRSLHKPAVGGQRHLVEQLLHRNYHECLVQGQSDASEC